MAIKLETSTAGDLTPHRAPALRGSAQFVNKCEPSKRLTGLEQPVELAEADAIVERKAA